jgi:hypothetical protein
LALAQMAGTANILHLRRDAQPSFSGRIHRATLNCDGPWMSSLLKIQRPVTPSAKGIGWFELNQFAIRKIAADNFACIHAGQCGRHMWCAECQSGDSAAHLCTTMIDTFFRVNHNCQVKTCIQPQLSPVLPA